MDAASPSALGAPPEQIEAGSLVMRRHRTSDASAVAEAVAESLAELSPWMPWADRASASAGFQRRRLEKAVPLWESGSEYIYLIFTGAGGHLAGTVGLHRRLGPGALEIGYWLRTGETGRGLMTTAVGALTAAALALPGIHRIEIHCDQANTKSAAIPRRLGYRLSRVEERTPQAAAETGHQMVWVASVGWAPAA